MNHICIKGRLSMKLIQVIIVTAIMYGFLSICAFGEPSTTTFETGPFTVAVDLGEICDIQIEEPTQNEMLDGSTYTSYIIWVCDSMITFTEYDTYYFNLEDDFGTNSIYIDLLKIGADKDTIYVAEREIDGHHGAVGSAFLPEYGTEIYMAGFYTSPRSVCHITVIGSDNYNRMITILRTIHIEEAHV